MIEIPKWHKWTPHFKCPFWQLHFEHAKSFHFCCYCFIIHTFRNGKLNEAVILWLFITNLQINSFGDFHLDKYIDFLFQESNWQKIGLRLFRELARFKNRERRSRLNICSFEEAWNCTPIVRFVCLFNEIQQLSSTSFCIMIQVVHIWCQKSNYSKCQNKIARIYASIWAMNIKEMKMSFRMDATNRHCDNKREIT